MNWIEKYNLYRKIKKSSPQIIEDKLSPTEPVRRIKWGFGDKYTVAHVHDLKYDWHTAYVIEHNTHQAIAVFSGFLARKIFNHLEKSL